MRISRIEIGSFGKFSNYSLELSPGTQVIFGQNEDGKTTLMAFVSMMFYSDQGRARDLDQNFRKKYQPWSGTSMEGALTFEWEGGNYHLSKQFGDTAGRDKTLLTNLDTGQPVALGKKEEVGSYFFGVDLSGFQRSSFIGQIGAISSGSGTDTIAEKLVSNLVDSGDEEISQQEVIGRLTTAKHDLVGKSGTIGRLVEVRKQCQELEETQQEIRFVLESQEEHQQQYEALESQRSQQKELQRIAAGYEASQQLGQLTQLLTAREELTQLADKLSAPAHPVEELEVFLEEASQLERELNENAGALLPLDRPVGDQPVIPISQEEHQRLTGLLRQQEQLAGANNRWERTIAPGFSQLFQQIETLTHLEEKAEIAQKTVKELGSEAEEHQQFLTRAEDSTTKLASLETQLEQKQGLWNEQESLKKERLENAREAAETLQVPDSSGKINLLLLFMGLVSLATFGLLGWFVSPLFYIGAPLSLLLLGFSFRKQKPSESPQKRMAEERVHTLEQELTQWEADQREAQTQFENKRKELTNQRAEAVREMEFTAAFTKEYQLAVASLTELGPQLKEANALVSQGRLTTDQQWEQLGEELGSFPQCSSLPPMDSLLELGKFSRSLEQMSENKRVEITALLGEKKVESLQEFEESYLAFQGSQKTREAILQLKETGRLLEQRFVQLLSTHSPVADYAAAQLLYCQLAEGYQLYLSTQRELVLRAKTLGITDTSVDALQVLIQEKQSQTTHYTGQPIEPILEQLHELSQRDLVAEMQQLQRQLRPPSRSLEDIAEELSTLTQQLTEMEWYYQGVSLALETMEAAREEMRRSFGPLLNESTSRIFAQLTGQRYDFLTVDKAYQIQVKSGIHLREWRYLSDGTIDQAYLALRLSVAQLITVSGALPLLLDDVLMQYDDQRARHALTFFKEYSLEKGCQILLFTCHHHTTQLAESLGIPTRPLLSGQEPPA